ncbi:phage integrase family protein [Rhizobium sp. BK251]|nr:phage integrase family protein [Rhizobium sp. BK251]
MTKLLLLTGQRRNEVAHAERKEFNLAGNDQEWVVPSTRAKNKKEHYVPLAGFAIEVINGIPRVSKDGEVKTDAKERELSGLLLTTNGQTPVSGFSKGKAAIDKEMLKVARKEAQERGGEVEDVSLDPWTLHDLRRTAASGMARLGHPVHVVEAALNHQSGTIRGVAKTYNRHTYAEEKRAALTEWTYLVKRIVEVSKEAS